LRRLIIPAVTVAFVATVWLANWLVHRFHVIQVWPTDLRAPAGVYVVGLAFVLRDFIQYRASRLLALAAIAAGTLLSIFVSPELALASGCAFAISEVGGLLVFWLWQDVSVALAVLIAGIAAAAIDSYVFLSLAPQLVPGLNNVEAFWTGQFVAKVTMSALAVPVVLGIRLRWPRAVTA
jgi:uncharacterized PurR-regulated membrane protein YhhQ (DUF165 family)